MRKIDPDPPHISASIYSHLVPERDIFKSMYELVRRHGASGVCVDLAPANSGFESVSDLAGTLSQVLVDNSSTDRFLTDDRSGRAVSAYLSHERVGPVILKYEQAKPPDRHPVSIIFSAGALGIPSEFWTVKDRAEARRIGTWAFDLFRAMCDDEDPLYGELAIENTLPAPNKLVESGRILYGDIYLSHQIVDQSDPFLASIRLGFGERIVSEWANGVLFSRWADFIEGRAPAANHNELTHRVNRLLVHRIKYL